ncbi:hypothetical protein TCSYLVIO_007624 [Trypanosoma cruzi]|nr:hypothetical protein TCSYLVIO_007628 [Trypanosoma cruzi]EKG01375.1 hypothetical protein TCSYLVIO_007624 [Trypanosoma cruzi]
MRGSSVYRNGSDSTLANQMSLYRISLATSPPASARRGTRSRRGALIQTASTAQEENRFACSEDEFAESSEGVERLPQNRLFNKVRSRSWAFVTLSGSVHGMFCVQEGSLNGSVKPLNDLTDQTDSGASLFLLFEQHRWARESGANGVPCRCSSGSPLSKGRNLLLLTCWRGKWHGRSRTDPSAPSLTDLRLSAASCRHRSAARINWADGCSRGPLTQSLWSGMVILKETIWQTKKVRLNTQARSWRQQQLQCGDILHLVPVGEGRHDAAWAPGG